MRQTQNARAEWAKTQSYRKLERTFREVRRDRVNNARKVAIASVEFEKRSSTSVRLFNGHVACNRNASPSRARVPPAGGPGDGPDKSHTRPPIVVSFPH